MSLDAIGVLRAGQGLIGDLTRSLRSLVIPRMAVLSGSVKRRKAYDDDSRIGHSRANDGTGTGEEETAMTTQDLRTHFNHSFGLGEWPESFSVDPDTYAHVCQTVFDHLVDKLVVQDLNGANRVAVSLGPHNGLMFKNVELLLIPQDGTRTGEEVGASDAHR